MVKRPLSVGSVPVASVLSAARAAVASTVASLSAATAGATAGVGGARQQFVAASPVAPATVLNPGPGAPAQTLHYGGSISAKTAALGCKPQRGTAFKVQRRFETIIRCENAGIPERTLAAMLSISVPRLRTIKKQPEYLHARMKITFGIVMDHAGEIAQIDEQRKEMLKQHLPAALQVLANALQAPANTVAEKKFQLSAAQDLLDREGTYAKVSRSEVKPVSFFDFEHADQSSADIIKAIRGVSQPVAGAAATVTNIINLSEKFSRSHTLSAVDQQKALDDLEKEILLEVEPASKLEQ